MEFKRERILTVEEVMQIKVSVTIISIFFFSNLTEPELKNVKAMRPTWRRQKKMQSYKQGQNIRKQDTSWRNEEEETKLVAVREQLGYTVKRLLTFPSLDGMSLTQLSRE